MSSMIKAFLEILFNAEGKLFLKKCLKNVMDNKYSSLQFIVLF